MKRCRYCHHRLWPWQSYTWEEMERTHDYAVLIHMKYEKDVWIHDGCFFQDTLQRDFIERRV